VFAIVSGALPHGSPYRVGQNVEVRRVRPDGANHENMNPHGGWLQGTVDQADGHQVRRHCFVSVILLCEHFDGCNGVLSCGLLLPGSRPL
jgi:hypothetical protein